MSKEQTLQRLKSEIQYDKLTVSFSIEGRDGNGVKKFSQFSATVSKADGGGWTPKEMPVVKALVSKQIVYTTYKDAIQRGVYNRKDGTSELKSVLENLDAEAQKYAEAMGAD